MLMSVWISGWSQGLIKIAAPVPAFLRHSEVASAAGAGRQECDEIKEAISKSRSGKTGQSSSRPAV